ncbi:MAG: WD40 repeat domain-containing protein [Myxococcales bacterium]|nr:WD40 repeat domain-containing protein [Myxococcales bacterium]
MSRLIKPRGNEAMSAPVLAAIGVYPCAMAWSSHGDVLAIGGDRGEVKLIDAITTETRLAFQAHDGPVQSLAWHPRRHTLLTTGQDGAARLWHRPYETSTELIAPGDTWVDHACWSASGDHAAVARGARAHVVVPSKTSIVTRPVGSTIAGLAFTPSGKSLGVASYGGVQLFDPATGIPTRTLAWKGSMLSIAFAPKGGVVACGCQDHSVHFWRIASGKDAEMSGFPAKPRRVSFSHDGRWLATGGDTSLSLWPFDGKGPEGRAPIQLDPHPDVITELAFAPRIDMLLSGSRDGTVALWMPPTLSTPVKTARLSGKVTHVGWATDVAAGVLRWAAADEHGRVMIGQL